LIDVVVVEARVGPGCVLRVRQDVVELLGIIVDRGDGVVAEAGNREGQAGLRLTVVERRV